MNYNAWIYTVKAVQPGGIVKDSDGDLVLAFAEKVELAST